MALVLIGAGVVFNRTVEFLHSDIDLMRVVPPKPTIYKAQMMWEVSRPEFVIDECELPY